MRHATRRPCSSRIASASPDGWTPLAETLAEAGLYFAGKPSWFNSGFRSYLHFAHAATLPEELHHPHDRRRAHQGPAPPASTIRLTSTGTSSATRTATMPTPAAGSAPGNTGTATRMATVTITPTTARTTWMTSPSTSTATTATRPGRGDFLRQAEHHHLHHRLQSPKPAALPHGRQRAGANTSPPIITPRCRKRSNRSWRRSSNAIRVSWRRWCRSAA